MPIDGLWGFTRPRYTPRQWWTAVAVAVVLAAVLTAVRSATAGRFVAAGDPPDAKIRPEPDCEVPQWAGRPLPGDGRR